LVVNKDISRIEAVNLDPKVFEKNLQQIGAQRELEPKKKDEKEEPVHAAIRTEDQVEFSSRAQKAGAQTGIAQHEGIKHTKKEKETEVPKTQVRKEDTSKPQVLTAKPLFASEQPRTAAEGGAPPPTTPPATTPPATGGSPTPPSATPATDAANRAKSYQDDINQANTIYAQMAADRQKWYMQIWQIMQDTQTQIMSIIQQVLQRRAAVMDKICEDWDAVINGTYK
jgi:hypothetical protein